MIRFESEILNYDEYMYPIEKEFPEITPIREAYESAFVTYADERVQGNRLLWYIIVVYAYVARKRSIKEIKAKKLKKSLKPIDLMKALVFFHPVLLEDIDCSQSILPYYSREENLYKFIEFAAQLLPDSYDIKTNMSYNRETNYFTKTIRLERLLPQRL